MTGHRQFRGDLEGTIPPAGLTGTMQIAIEGRRHSYDFTYALRP